MSWMQEQVRKQARRNMDGNQQQLQQIQQQMSSRLAPAFNNLSQIKQGYDAIYEQNSSYLESLLVSPHCSKYQRLSLSSKRPEDGHLGDNSLSEYIKPFESEQLNKTQSKNRKRSPNLPGSRSKAQPQDQNDQFHQLQQSNVMEYVARLEATLRKKDQKINILERNIENLTSSKSIYIPKNTEAQLTTAGRTLHTMVPHNQPEDDLDDAHSPKHQRLRFKSMKKLQEQLEKCNREIEFLTANNHELFAQLATAQEQHQRVKKAFTAATFYNKDLEERIKSLAAENERLVQLNSTLVGEKREMLAKYEQQLRIFARMQRAYHKLNDDSEALSRTAPRSRSRGRSRTAWRHQYQNQTH